MDSTTTPTAGSTARRTTFPKRLRACGIPDRPDRQVAPRLRSDRVRRAGRSCRGRGPTTTRPMIRDGNRVEREGYTSPTSSPTSASTGSRTARPVEAISADDASTRPRIASGSRRLRHLGHDGDRAYPEPPTLFDDLLRPGQGRARPGHDDRADHDPQGPQAHPAHPPHPRPAQTAWDAYYAPRNAAFEAAHPRRTQRPRPLEVSAVYA